jgi:pyruvate, water dikinase
MWSIRRVVKACHKHGITASICGQAPSEYPEMVKKLVSYGITSISVNPDVINKTRKIIMDAEKEVGHGKNK